MEVNDEVRCELQKMAHEGPNTKYTRSLAQEGTAVRLDICMRVGMVDEAEEEVDEEGAGEQVEVEHDGADLELDSQGRDIVKLLNV